MSKEKTTECKALTRDQQKLITPEIMGYAEVLAHRYEHCGVDLEDLVQEAYYGLCRAALNYKEGSGATFKTYATSYIKKYCIIAVEKYGSIFLLKREDRRFILSYDEGWDSEEGDHADDLNDDKDSQSDFAEEDDAFSHSMTKEKAEGLMTTLNEQERCVIQYRYGMNGESEASISEVAKAMKIQPTRVRQIYNKAISKMQMALSEEDLNQ